MKPRTLQPAYRNQIYWCDICGKPARRLTWWTPKAQRVRGSHWLIENYQASGIYCAKCAEEKAEKRRTK